MDKSLSVHELVLVDILHVEMENVQVEAFDTFFFTFFSSLTSFVFSIDSSYLSCVLGGKTRRRGDSNGS